MRDYREDKFGIPVRENLAALYFMNRSMDNVWTVFTRNQHGVIWPGIPGFVCWCILLLASAMSESQELLAFTGVWTIALVIPRIEARKLFNKGLYQYSSYTGFPWLTVRLCPSFSEIRAKNMEPLICLGIAFLALQVNEAIGSLLMVGALSLAGVRISDAYSNFREATALRDAEIAMRQAAMRYRGWDEF
jgi:hypothetical protein